MGSYRQIWDSEWEPLPKDWYLQCCDCGLCHRIRLRIRDGKPEIQMTRDNRRTGQIRRWKKARNGKAKKKG